jgi:serine/threonine protein kinase
VNLGYYGEEDAKRITKGILEAVNYLHNAGIVHRDLKPENLLMASKNDDSDVKLADFGLSTIVTNDSMLKTSCGTLTYCAPEILRGEAYGKPVDLWSIGVITYILLSGYPPFWDKDEAVMMELTLRGTFTCTSCSYSFLSRLGRSIARGEGFYFCPDSSGFDETADLFSSLGDALVEEFQQKREKLD